MATYDYPEGMTGARRRPRRPVAGGLPSPQLEAMLDVYEDQPELPLWAWSLVGFTAGAAAVACGAFVALVAVWRHYIG